jgi:hypothetical protein
MDGPRRRRRVSDPNLVPSQHHASSPPSPSARIGYNTGIQAWNGPADTEAVVVGKAERSTMRLTIEIDGKDTVVELDEEIVDALRSIAERNGLSLEEAIGQAIVNERTLEDAVDGGGQLLIEKNDKLRRLEYA